MATYFRSLLGQSESSNNYSAVNDDGFTGKYQWGPDLLSDFNKAHDTSYTLEDFGKDPDLQEIAQEWSEGRTLNYIKSRGLDKYFGTVIDGTVMTPTAMLAMAHLGGPTGMYKYVTSGGSHNPDDGLTALSDYAKKFSVTLPEGMGQTKLSFPEGTEQSNENRPPAEDPSRRKALQTAMSGFEMLQDSGADFCPAGTVYDPLSGKCITSAELMRAQIPDNLRPRKRPEYLSPPENTPRPQPRPFDVGITALLK